MGSVLRPIVAAIHPKNRYRRHPIVEVRQLCPLSGPVTKGLEKVQVLMQLHIYIFWFSRMHLDVLDCDERESFAPTQMQSFISDFTYDAAMARPELVVQSIGVAKKVETYL